MEPAKNQPSQESSLHFLDYWRIIRIRKTIIITVFLITSVIATVVTFLLPASYSSMAVIKIENDSASDVQNIGNASMVAPYDPYFIQTEFKIMQSQQVLGRVITKLDLNNVWGKEYNNNVPFTTDETMLLLKQRMDLSPERNTKLIDITVYSGDRNEAAKLANAIADAYREYRFSLHTELATNGIGVLEQSFEADQDKIRVAQSNVDFLRSNLKIVDSDPNATGPSPTLSQADVQKYNDNMLEDKELYTKHEKQLTGLEGYDKEKLRDVLPGMVTDVALNDMLSNLHLSEQKLVQMTNSLGSANPDVISLQALIGELNSEIDGRVDGIMVGLKSQLADDKAALDDLTAQLEAAKEKDQEEAQRGQPYWETKRDLESDIQFHALLQAKIASEQLDLQIPKTSMVEIIDRAEPGKDPVRPNKTLNIILGIIIGLAVGIGLAFFIEYLDTSVKTIDDVERAFQAPVLGVIPQNVGYLVDDKDGENRHAEAYRVLAHQPPFFPQG